MREIKNMKVGTKKREKERGQIERKGMREWERRLLREKKNRRV